MAKRDPLADRLAAVAGSSGAFPRKEEANATKAKETKEQQKKSEEKKPEKDSDDPLANPMPENRRKEREIEQLNARLPGDLVQQFRSVCQSSGVQQQDALALALRLWLRAVGHPMPGDEVG